MIWGAIWIGRRSDTVIMKRDQEEGIPVGHILMFFQISCPLLAIWYAIHARKGPHS